ncbi:hypothetical protein SteCoe_13026 [Stentor coeruleus]|uniref:Uncharacterized protein n=1 Tax=Stentor coeruleus TaxID=5963 RepID=A0A1R2C9C5_9CILI|nr:hypothetical protein SteCoe_13026 [Stentor coeruleus]
MAQVDAATKDLVLNCIKESKKLEKANKLSEALSVLDRISNFHDSRTVSVSMSITKQIASLCNQIVIQKPSKVSYLKRAEQVLTSWIHLANSLKISLHEKIFRLILLTYNNWATIYQSNANYHLALSYLMKGFQIIDEKEIIEADSFQYVAKTKLNVSALYSELHRYQDAIKFAEDSLATLQAELRLRFSAKNFKNMEGKEKKHAEDMITTYVIAFYNIGVAEEHLGHRDQMCEAFKNAVNIGTNFLDLANEALNTARKALAECSGPQNNFTLLTSRRSIKILPDMLSDRFAKQRPISASSHLPISERKFLRPKDLISKNKDLSMPGRYYSEAKLKKIQQRIEDAAKLNFISADEYFYKEISRTMNIASDIKFLKPMKKKRHKKIWELQIEDKRKISSLRLKKQHRWEKESLNTSRIQRIIDKLKEEDEDTFKKQEVKIKSKMKTKVYKQLLRSISSRKNSVYPPQRLSFKPPIKEIVRKDGNDVQTPTNEIENNIKNNEEKRALNVQMTKDEIENMMEKINEDMRHIDIAKGVSKEPHPDDFGARRLDGQCVLARSTLKGLSAGKSDFKFLKSAIGSSIRNTSKKTTSPKILLRSNTLVNFQV